MDKPAHTPGPWLLTAAKKSVVAQPTVILPNGEKRWTTRRIAMFTYNDNVADAYLIAAAPDMLAALRHASWLLADISPDGLVKKQIDEVIARATPETTP